MRTEGTVESKENNYTEPRGVAIDKALYSQEAPVCQVFTILVDLIFCYHDACLPGFHQWHFLLFQFFLYFSLFSIFLVLPRRLFARFSPG